jgi:hypothetical protein
VSPDQPLPEPWDDGLFDAIALVGAQLAGDVIGIAAVMRCGNPFSRAVVLSKMLAEVITEHDVSPEHFRAWAESCVDRP